MHKWRSAGLHLALPLLSPEKNSFKAIETSR
jgi:hypothetical protein